MAPVGKEDISRPTSRLRQQICCLLRRSQSSRLGSMVNHVPDGIVLTDAVPVSTASNLMVPEGIGDTMTPRAHKFIVVERNAQPIGEAASKFAILQVKAE